MAWGARWYFVGFVLFGILGVLAGCSGGMFAERERWRREAEVQCLDSGAIKEGPGIVRMRAITGPGMCGADFPLKVSTLSESVPLSYSDDPRPPAAIPGATPRWPIRPGDPATSQPDPMPPPVQSRVLPQYRVPSAPPVQGGTMYEPPVSIIPPNVPDQAGGSAEYDFRRPYRVTREPVSPPRDDFARAPYERRPL